MQYEPKGKLLGQCTDGVFWGKLKTEWLRDKKLKTIDEAKSVVFEYIEIFYNRDRVDLQMTMFVPVRSVKRLKR